MLHDRRGDEGHARRRALVDLVGVRGAVCSRRWWAPRAARLDRGDGAAAVVAEIAGGGEHGDDDACAEGGRNQWNKNRVSCGSQNGCPHSTRSKGLGSAG